jgi:hypothetical protein
MDVHKLHKAGVVGWLDQMRHLMQNNIFEAFHRLFRQIGVQSDIPRGRGAASLFRFHSLNQHAVHLDLQNGFPFRDHRADLRPDLAPIKGVEQSLSRSDVRVGTNVCSARR